MAARRATDSKKGKPLTIDREKLRAAIRRIGDEYMFYLLDDLIDVVPEATLAKIAGRYVRLDELRSVDAGSTSNVRCSRM